jgi:hypothetical protein
VHVFVKELSSGACDIDLIPNVEESDISFQSGVTKKFKVVLVDTCRFMASNLVKFVGILTKLRIVTLKQLFPVDKFVRVTQ